ncbi:paralemmin-3 [Dipodomys merriami]|uniref:paralemmin-3 n=1 Tax=Dipodomys merriami TaxID=94247 RepID=UPI0038559E5A
MARSTWGSLSLPPCPATLVTSMWTPHLGHPFLPPKPDLQEQPVSRERQPARRRPRLVNNSWGQLIAPGAAPAPQPPLLGLPGPNQLDQLCGCRPSPPSHPAPLQPPVRTGGEWVLNSRHPKVGLETAMALQSQAWAPATPMPMAESSLYRQRLEVIAEKRRLQEDIRAARRELEEERLRAQRLKRKSLRERWLMDGAAEARGDPTSQDSPSPEAQAQTRIRSLEDSLFTLQSQLQLLQSASTGAQHRPAARPTWRRQGHRPLSHPAMEASAAGHTDREKRASLPARPAAVSPGSPPEPREEAPGVHPAPGTGTSSESNGPYCGPSPATPRPAADSAVEAERGDGVVEVVWAALRPTEDSAPAPTGRELEAEVEAAVQEAIGARQAAGSPGAPAWVRADGAGVELVWEGLGGSCVEAPGVEAARAPGGSPGAPGPGDPAGEAASFIWVERVTLAEDWELVTEGPEGPTAAPAAEGVVEAGQVERTGEGAGGEAAPGPAAEREAGAAAEPGPGGGGERGEGPAGADAAARPEAEAHAQGEQEQGRGEAGGEKEAEGTPAAGGKAGDGPLDGERGGSEPLDGDRKGNEPLDGERRSEPLDGEIQGSESLDGERRESEPLDGERRGSEPLDGERRGSEPLDGEIQGSEPLDGEIQGSEPLHGERRESEPLDGERRGSEPLDGERRRGEPLDGERRDSEPLDGESGGMEEKPPEAREKPSSGGPGESAAPPAEEGGVPPEETPEEPGLRPGVRPEGFPEQEAGKAEAPAEGPAGEAAPLPTETPGPPPPPPESQPLLPRERPSAHPAPTYAPARQPAPAEGGEANGPKQKTCQCCAVM